LTELAFARIVSNPSFSKDALPPSQALQLLEQNLKHPRHIFWAADLPVCLGSLGNAAALRGHQQIMDSYLLQLARKHRGMLTTFDQAMKTSVSKELLAHLEIIIIS
jgi:hypothetical protein